jgi:hypothetical protein
MNKISNTGNGNLYIYSSWEERRRNWNEAIDEFYKRQQQEEEEYLKCSKSSDINKNKKNYEEYMNNISVIQKEKEIFENINKNWRRYSSKNVKHRMKFIGATISTKYILKVIDDLI